MQAMPISRSCHFASRMLPILPGAANDSHEKRPHHNQAERAEDLARSFPIRQPPQAARVWEFPFKATHAMPAPVAQTIQDKGEAANAQGQGAYAKAKEERGHLPILPRT